MVCGSKNDSYCTQRVWSKERLQATEGTIQTDNNTKALYLRGYWGAWKLSAVNVDLFTNLSKGQIIQMDLDDC